MTMTPVTYNDVGIWHCAMQFITNQILEHNTHFEMYLFVCHLLSILESFAGSFV